MPELYVAMPEAIAADRHSFGNILIMSETPRKRSGHDNGLRTMFINEATKSLNSCQVLFLVCVERQVALNALGWRNILLSTPKDDNDRVG